MKQLKLTSLFLLALTGTAIADPADTPADIDRDGDALRDELSLRPDDRDITDTAVVATNTSSQPAVMICAAFDSNGHKLGAASMRVPAKGLRYVRASDLSNGIDYVGQVKCRTGNHGIHGSVFLMGPGGTTDMPVLQRGVNGSKHIVAPVTASF
ncbi:MAG: hypothetical protein QF515_18855 [Pseudomonadales bacterium]|jgi:hypothetical protein|nr:hypothetical protein [Pseudomonadales bacterium]MDP6469983.1 hypothetical protein [Pseudomonadales bacterium]MDP6829151.1 hypothetical protein [Pseudomonadales bacterium]|tara:strand:+ start:39 stop:500 length:462 start_codon:yes stop_codon:yes gene_type:complete